MIFVCVSIRVKKILHWLLNFLRLCIITIKNLLFVASSVETVDIAFAILVILYDATIFSNRNRIRVNLSRIIRYWVSALSMFIYIDNDVTIMSSLLCIIIIIIIVVVVVVMHLIHLR